ncbi:hypothetical protein ACFQS7_29650 [Dankookia sp. GCM10030260]|uniref:hypothetical protein n=1 Tax=Dankookia sp. GCM10030260 TaxID=3273390 RepID=UPI003616329F
MLPLPANQQALDRMTVLGKGGIWIASAHGIAFALAANLGTAGIGALMPAYGQPGPDGCMVRFASAGIIRDAGALMFLAALFGGVALFGAYLPLWVTFWRRRRIFWRGTKEAPLSFAAAERITHVQSFTLLFASVILLVSVVNIIDAAKNFTQAFVTEYHSKLAAECPTASPAAALEQPVALDKAGPAAATPLPPASVPEAVSTP